jgi:hypothetical protein
MEALNTSFYFVTDKIVELQTFFLNFSKSIAYVVLLVAVLIAAFNFALTGTGMKESVVKIVKALMFYYVVIFAYPSIVSWMTSISFSLANESTYSTISGYLKNAAEGITTSSRERVILQYGQRWTYVDTITAADDTVFKNIIAHRKFTTGNGREFSYSTVTPSAAVGSILLVAGECMRYVNKYDGSNIATVFSRTLIGYVCAFVVIFAGVFAVLEYLIAFIEFMFISSVGIILFPFSLWDGTKFLAEKFITAMLGFFIKLLFCSICIFLLLYGFISIAKDYSNNPFTGQPEEVVMLFFSSLLLFYLAKSAPGLAQSLLTGAPSLSAAGAINTVVAGVGAAAGVAGMAGGAAGTIGKGVSAASGAIAQGTGAYKAAAQIAKESGGSEASAGMRAFAQSMGSQAWQGAGDLTKSLFHMPQNVDGSYKTIPQYLSERQGDGARKYRQSHPAPAPPPKDPPPPPEDPPPKAPPP